MIGDAARRLPAEFKVRHGEIPWHKIAGLRHRIVHAYFDVDVELVWAVVTAELPGLKAALTNLRQTWTTGA